MKKVLLGFLFIACNVVKSASLHADSAVISSVHQQSLVKNNIVLILAAALAGGGLIVWAAWRALLRAINKKIAEQVAGQTNAHMIKVKEENSEIRTNIMHYCEIINKKIYDYQSTQLRLEEETNSQVTNLKALLLECKKNQLEKEMTFKTQIDDILEYEKNQSERGITFKNQIDYIKKCYAESEKENKKLLEGIIAIEARQKKISKIIFFQHIVEKGQEGVELEKKDSILASTIKQFYKSVLPIMLNNIQEDEDVLNVNPTILSDYEQSKEEAKELSAEILQQKEYSYSFFNNIENRKQFGENFKFILYCEESNENNPKFKICSKNDYITYLKQYYLERGITIENKKLLPYIAKQHEKIYTTYNDICCNNSTGNIVYIEDNVRLLFTYFNEIKYTNKTFKTPKNIFDTISQELQNSILKINSLAEKKKGSLYTTVASENNELSALLKYKKFNNINPVEFKLFLFTNTTKEVKTEYYNFFKNYLEGQLTKTEKLTFEFEAIQAKMFFQNITNKETELTENFNNNDTVLDLRNALYKLSPY
jgi:hypothetical protein